MQKERRTYRQSPRKPAPLSEETLLKIQLALTLACIILLAWSIWKYVQ